LCQVIAVVVWEAKVAVVGAERELEGQGEAVIWRITVSAPHSLAQMDDQHVCRQVEELAEVADSWTACCTAHSLPQKVHCSGACSTEARNPWCELRSGGNFALPALSWEFHSDSP
jgi:hypothetical protein